LPQCRRLSSLGSSPLGERWFAKQAGEGRSLYAPALQFGVAIWRASAASAARLSVSAVQPSAASAEGSQTCPPAMRSHAACRPVRRAACANRKGGTGNSRGGATGRRGTPPGCRDRNRIRIADDIVGARQPSRDRAAISRRPPVPATAASGCRERGERQRPGESATAAVRTPRASRRRRSSRGAGSRNGRAGRGRLPARLFAGELGGT